MKRLSYISYDIFLNERNVGDVTVGYHYDQFDAPGEDYVTVEVFFNRHLNDLPGIIRSGDVPQYYQEEKISTDTPAQAEEMALSLIRRYVINSEEYRLELGMRRQVFYLRARSQKRPRFLLIHELYAQPNFKQVQDLVTNRIVQYPITESDDAIYADAFERLQQT